MIDNNPFANAVAEELDLPSSAYASEVAGEVDLTSSAYASDVVDAINNKPEPPVEEPDLRVLQLNIGHFNQGYAAAPMGTNPSTSTVLINSNKSDGYPSNLNRNYAVQLQRWKELISGLDEDGMLKLIGMPEWNNYFGYNGGTAVTTVNSGIFNGFNLSVGDAVAGGWWQHTLASKFVMSDDGDYPLGSTGGNPAYARYATIYIKNKPVKIVVTHLNWSSSNAAMLSRTAEIQSLVNWLKDEQYVILLGDFNTDGQYVQSASKTEAQFMSGADEFNPFITAGFTLANHGAWGDLLTCDATDSRPDHLTDSIRGNNNPDTFYNRPFCVLDNIIVKGFTISNVKMLDTDVFDNPSDPLDIGMLTDHCGLICGLTMID